MSRILDFTLPRAGGSRRSLRRRGEECDAVILSPMPEVQLGYAVHETVCVGFYATRSMPNESG